MKKILVPTDFSKEAELALKAAAQIAKKNKAEIFAIHLVDIPTYETWNNQTYQEASEGIMILKSIKRKFKELLSRPFLDGIRVTEVVAIEESLDNIHEKVEKYQIDLIVMGTHGASWWKEFISGSNSEKVVRSVQCPVLTIKKETTAFAPKDVVFASSFFGETEGPFKSIKEFCSLFNSNLHLLKIITKNEFETTAYSNKVFHDFKEEMSLLNATTHLINADSIEEGITYFTKNHPCDVLAVETHGRKGIKHLLNGSIAEDLVNHISVPVLTMKIPKFQWSN